MGGFTKLFSTIITSSIWSEDDKVRLMWITMLASADASGYVSGSVPGMAAIARMSLQDAERSIKTLCEPDPYSRSKEYEGRRLEEADGGWVILNYAKYREKRDPERRREQNREAKRRQRQRAKNQLCQQMSANVSHMSAQAEVRREKQKTDKKRARAKRTFVAPTLEQVKEYISANPELSNVDPVHFWKSFNDSGWVDTRGNPVGSWKMKVRTWSKNDDGRQRLSKTEPNTEDQAAAVGQTPRARISSQSFGVMLRTDE